MKAKKNAIEIKEITNSNSNGKVIGFGCPPMTEGPTECRPKCLLRDSEIYMHCSEECGANPELMYDNYAVWEDIIDGEELVL